MSSLYALQNFYELIWLYQPVKNTRSQLYVNTVKDIVNYWGTHKEVWFSHQTLEPGQFMLQQETYKDTFNMLVSLIIQYDQLYRHPTKESITKYNTVAHSFATHCAFLVLHKHKIEFLQAEAWKQVFILLVIRHHKNINLKMFSLGKVQMLIERSIQNDVPIHPLYIRFMNATIMDINNMKNKEQYIPFSPPQQTQTQHQMTHAVSITINTTTNTPTPETQVFNHKALHHDYKDIVDIASIENIRLLSDQFHTYNIQDATKKTVKTFMTAFEQHIVPIMKTRHSNTIAVSLSGGVDSMVCSYIMKLVADKHKYNLICLHICYHNRQEVSKEVMFIHKWCECLKLPLYVRHINEIQRIRNTKFRSCYEEVTRKIRFSFYDVFKCPIILGHNMDDCFENLFSNLSKQIHFDNVYGMSPVSVESSITIVRPFLQTAKRDIIEFANKALIPHLYDSTPPWSRRGKTRDSLMPAINQFDPHIIPGLKAFVEYTNFLSKNWHNTFEEWIQPYIHSKETHRTNEVYSIVIDKDEFFTLNVSQMTFWIQLWFSLDLPTRPSNKSFRNVMHIIENNQYVLCNLNKHFTVHNKVDSIHIMKVA